MQAAGKRLLDHSLAQPSPKKGRFEPKIDFFNKLPPEIVEKGLLPHLAEYRDLLTIGSVSCAWRAWSHLNKPFVEKKLDKAFYALKSFKKSEYIAEGLIRGYAPYISELTNAEYWDQKLIFRNFKYFSSLTYVEIIISKRNPARQINTQKLANVINKAASLKTFVLTMHSGVGKTYIMASLSQSLAVNTTITTLYFDGVELLPREYSSFGTALKENQTIDHLGLHWMNLSKGIEPLVDGFQNNKSIKWIEIKGSQLSDDNLVKLIDSFGRQESLFGLCLKHEEVGPESAKALSRLIDRCRELKRLDIRHISRALTIEGIQTLFSAIKKNPSLTYFKLKYPHIDIATDPLYGLEIVDLIQNNQKLAIIYFGGLETNRFCLELMGKAIAANQHIESITLNFMSLEGTIIPLLKGCADNNSLKKISFTHFGEMRESHLNKIIELIRKTRTLQKIKLGCSFSFTKKEKELFRNRIQGHRSIKEFYLSFVIQGSIHFYRLNDE